MLADEAKAALDHAPTVLPFMMVAASPPQVNKTRLLEAVITAVVSGAIIAGAGYMFALPVLQSQVEEVKRDLRDLKQDIKEIKNQDDDRSTRLDDRLRRVEINQGGRRQ